MTSSNHVIETKVNSTYKKKKKKTNKKPNKQKNQKNKTPHLYNSEAKIS